MMNRLEKIVDAISSITKLPYNNIIRGRGKDGPHAQTIFCFIVSEYFPEEIDELSKMTFIPVSGCYAKHRDFTNEIKSSKKSLILVNKILRQLSLKPTGLNADDYKESWSISKRIFGIKNTLYDEIDIMDAIDKSDEFFKSYGKGISPKYIETEPDLAV